MGRDTGAQLVLATWDEVAGVAGELPITEERSPNEWRVGKKLIAWERPLRAQVPDEGIKFALIVDAWLTQAPKHQVQEFSANLGDLPVDRHVAPSVT